MLLLVAFFGGCGPHDTWPPDVARDTASWDAADDAERSEAARSVEAHVADVRFTGLDSVPTPRGARRIAVFHHDRTSLDFVLVPGVAQGVETGEPGRTGVRPFLCARTEATQQAWTRVREDNLSAWSDPSQPVENVEGTKVLEYCAAVGVDLPTAAEWEHAYRGGGVGDLPEGVTMANIQEYGNFADATLDRFRLEVGDVGDEVEIAMDKDDGAAGTRACASYRPNGSGLFDVVGNVAEFTYATPEEIRAKGQGYPREWLLAIRGGHWSVPPALCTLSGSVAIVHRTYRRSVAGFRPVIRLVDVDAAADK